MSFLAGRVVCGGVGCVMWHVGDMEGTCGIVDPGDDFVC